MFTKNKYLIFKQNTQRMLTEFVAKGGNVNDLKSQDEIYRYIKGTRVISEDGKLLTLEEKFAYVGFPRQAKQSKDVRTDLIFAINSYIEQGGSFHVNRKSFPFYPELLTYSSHLKRKGINMTHEEIMHEIGFDEYSDLYFRSLGIFNLSKYRDEKGFVDSYREDERMAAFVTDLAISLQLPICLLVSLISDEKLKKNYISLDKIKYTQRALENYAKENGSFLGIKRNAPDVYEMFNYLVKYYSDGSQQRYSREEWLQILGLDEYAHEFQDKTPNANVDIEEIMVGLKEKYGTQVIKVKDLDSVQYHVIVKKAVAMGITVSELFRIYELKCNGIAQKRLSSTTLSHIPYLQEMKRRRDELILQLADRRTTTCKEGFFETKVKACLQVYQEFKERLETYMPEAIDCQDNKFVL